MLSLHFLTEAIAVGEFELSMIGDRDLEFYVATTVDGSILSWDGTIRFDAVADRIEGEFEVEPREEPFMGVVTLEDGAFSCATP